ncbi:sulfate ABC transporter permease [Vibrio lentus]|uniref:sulfate ABC transporter permease n=1 Tax=Vibrio lentus TaxID=136468 RepID=UPI000977E229|nr:sulfate ABC transporter permease [Vibrio lentus]OMO22213.1 sulfate ABC transporter permease [Vibrio lentus]PMN15296.1 sulfate ABC transporter permease [Vibrio lentus]
MKKIITSVLCASIASPAFAIIELTDNLSLSGFGSTSWATSDHDSTLMINRNINDDSCFDCDTTFGIQLDYYYDSFRTSIQVVKRPQDHWSDPQLEWAYVGYEFGDFDFTAGRLRLPLFLASEYYYVGQAYMTARPPTEVYNSVLGITAFNGLKVSWNYELNDETNLQLTPFYGINDENDVDFNSAITFEFETDRMYGANVQISGDTYRWNFAYLNSTFDQDTIITGLPFPISTEDQNIKLWSLGSEYEFGQFLFTTEGQISDFSSSMYTSLGYHFGSFTPYVVYGAQFDSNEHLKGNSYLLGVDYDVLPNISINGEVQYLEARAASSTDLNSSFLTFGSSPADEAWVYTIMLSFVF